MCAGKVASFVDFFDQIHVQAQTSFPPFFSLKKKKRKGGQVVSLVDVTGTEKEKYF